MACRFLKIVNERREMVNDEARDTHLDDVENKIGRMLVKLKVSWVHCTYYFVPNFRGGAQ